MGQEPALTVPEELLELRTLLKAEWPTRRAALVPGTIVNLEGDDPDDPAPLDDPALAPPAAQPPWGTDNFDADRAWKLLQDTRADRERFKSERDGLAEQVRAHEDASKSEQEKLEERTTLAEQQAAASVREAARLRVALKKGLTETQAKRLVGDTEEELEADADELLASFISPADDDLGQDPEPLRRPRERLRPGAAPSSEPEVTDPRQLAAQVPRS